MDAYKDLLDRRSTFSIDSLLSSSGGHNNTTTTASSYSGLRNSPPPSISYSSLAALRSPMILANAAAAAAVSRLPSLPQHLGEDDLLPTAPNPPGSPILDPGSNPPATSGGTTILPGFHPGPFPSPYGDPALLSHMLASLSQRHQHQLLAAAAAATAAASAAAASAHNHSQNQVRHEEPDTTNEQGKIGLFLWASNNRLEHSILRKFSDPGAEMLGQASM